MNLIFFNKFNSKFKNKKLNNNLINFQRENCEEECKQKYLYQKLPLDILGCLKKYSV